MAMMVTMLKAIELPARVADLTTCLANVDRDAPDGNCQLGYEMSVKESWLTYSRMVVSVKWFKKPPKSLRGDCFSARRQLMRAGG